MLRIVTKGLQIMIYPLLLVIQFIADCLRYTATKYYTSSFIVFAKVSFSKLDACMYSFSDALVIAT